MQGAWSGHFVPWLPIGVLGVGVAGGALVAATLVDRSTMRRIGVIAAGVSVLAFGAVLLIGRDTVSLTAATTMTATPGWPVIVATAVAGGLVVGGLAGAGRARPRRTAPMAAALLGLAVVTGACMAGPGPSEPASIPASADPAPDWRTDPSEPYPFRTPIPDLLPTELDGEYTRPPTDTYTGDRAACRRCPPFPPDRGESILRLDRGRYEMLHEEPAYRSFGHFTYDGELLTLLNDPECGSEIGTYRVERDGAELRFDVVEDPCAFAQRSRDLMARTWTPTDIARGESCQPPNTEAAVSGHWPEPSHC
ncbi:MAG: hypothetical protein KY392_01940 [Chloroflexi bacterium]|nr:hypothetical protein [Chloroflexota bacterium]